MPEHRSRGRTRRGIAIALIAPAAVVAGIFTAAGLATGSTSSPVAQPTDVPQLPSEIAPPTGVAPGSPTGTPTGTRTGPTQTRTGTATPRQPGPGTPSATGTAGATCLSPTATGTRTGGPAPTATRTSPSPTRTSASPTRTGATPVPSGPSAAPTGNLPSGVEVPQALATGTPSSMPPTGPTTLRVGTAGGKSDVLVDQNGCALYLNTSDTSERTDTPAAAETTWIPVPAPATAAGGLDQSKVGTFTRPDGKSQATYNGHQLYRFAGDHAPGEAKGQGVDGKYFLVGQNGDPVK